MSDDNEQKSHWLRITVAEHWTEALAFVVLVGCITAYHIVKVCITKQ